MSFVSKEINCPFAGKITRFFESRRASTYPGAGHVDVNHREGKIRVNTAVGNDLIDTDKARNHAGFILHACQLADSLKVQGGQ